MPGAHHTVPRHTTPHADANPHTPLRRRQTPFRSTQSGVFLYAKDKTPVASAAAAREQTRIGCLHFESNVGPLNGASCMCRECTFAMAPSVAGA
ncbi:uncharacterized protein VDAG_07601 [Verticillium dahliae VdLs.17]|uniref:Uncharacterized protein n=1 Tax=Verticillium dahliae (strain VdLs.17 / ATCC MYA-4575 / FGSC 10137) TaxID=498257 RepID=G2XC23_VERDV|nr:uncharacterized protein VDAG_07601 [Verticillium dahliae VdLs.17]EGY16437.1 hypothetical protein VDAG_07601 [Verticillium dahliae VdLs.17]